MSCFVQTCTCEGMAVVVTGLWAGQFWVLFLMVQEIFILSKMCRLPVALTLPPVQCMLGV